MMCLIIIVYSYMMSVLERIIVDQYIIVYLHSGAPPNSRPSLQLLRRFYDLVDKRSVLYGVRVCVCVCVGVWVWVRVWCVCVWV